MIHWTASITLGNLITLSTFIATLFLINFWNNKNTNEIRIKVDILWKHLEMKIGEKIKIES